jgi:hypothetical protein
VSGTNGLAYFGAAQPKKVLQLIQDFVRCDIQHNDTQHNDTQHNDTQHNGIHSAGQ